MRGPTTLTVTFALIDSPEVVFRSRCPRSPRMKSLSTAPAYIPPGPSRRPPPPMPGRGRIEAADLARQSPARLTPKYYGPENFPALRLPVLAGTKLRFVAELPQGGREFEVVVRHLLEA
jgi:hypothetical protein